MPAVGEGGYADASRLTVGKVRAPASVDMQIDKARQDIPAPGVQLFGIFGTGDADAGDPAVFDQYGAVLLHTVLKNGRSVSDPDPFILHRDPPLLPV